jgi:hypothetical protein
MRAHGGQPGEPFLHQNRADALIASRRGRDHALQLIHAGVHLPLFGAGKKRGHADQLLSVCERPEMEGGGIVVTGISGSLRGQAGPEVVPSERKGVVGRDRPDLGATA